MCALDKISMIETLRLSLIGTDTSLLFKPMLKASVRDGDVCVWVEKTFLNKRALPSVLTKFSSRGVVGRL